MVGWTACEVTVQWVQPFCNTNQLLFINQKSAVHLQTQISCSLCSIFDSIMLIKIEVVPK